MAREFNNELRRIGRNLKVARTARGWTQEELAFALGESGKPVDRAYISRIETGQHNPSAIAMIRLARALTTHPASLLDGIE